MDFPWINDYMSWFNYLNTCVFEFLSYLPLYTRRSFGLYRTKTVKEYVYRNKYDDKIFQGLLSYHEGNLTRRYMYKQE